MTPFPLHLPQLRLMTEPSCPVPLHLGQVLVFLGFVQYPILITPL